MLMTAMMLAAAMKIGAADAAALRKRVLEKLTGVPLDIEPRFTAATSLLAEEAASASGKAR
jgi:hypothetical protein